MSAQAPLPTFDRGCVTRPGVAAGPRYVARGVHRPRGYLGWFSNTSRPSIFGDTVPSCEM